MVKDPVQSNGPTIFQDNGLSVEFVREPHLNIDLHKAVEEGLAVAIKSEEVGCVRQLLDLGLLQEVFHEETALVVVELHSLFLVKAYHPKCDDGSQKDDRVGGLTDRVVLVEDQLTKGAKYTINSIIE